MATGTKPLPQSTAAVPQLNDGDWLSEAEFWRRYEAAPDGVRAELIFGVVHLNRWFETDEGGREQLVPLIAGGGHGQPHAAVIGWIFHYSTYTPGTESSAPSSVRRVTPDTTPEPDASLRILPEFGGRTTDDENGYVHGGPELVIEVANTSAAYDLGVKLEAYRTGGVVEYLVWRTRLGRIDWFRLNRAGRYVPIPTDPDGLLRSRVFPGLWLDPKAMIEVNAARVLDVVQQGLASPEHAAFVAKLARKKR